MDLKPFENAKDQDSATREPYAAQQFKPTLDTPAGEGTEALMDVDSPHEERWQEVASVAAQQGPQVASTSRLVEADIYPESPTPAWTCEEKRHHGYCVEGIECRIV